MNVLYLYDGPWPKGATRVRKETRALAQAGHIVTLVARNAENALATEEEPWMTVRRLPRIPGQRLRYALNFPLFVNPVWLFTIWRVIRQTKPDVIVVCDLPLAPCAVWFGWLCGIPVQYDMAEIYPVFLESIRQLEDQSVLSRFIRHPKLAAWTEQYVLKRVELVHVVSLESRDRCIGLGVQPRKLTIVGNTPESLTEFEQSHPVPTDIVELVHGGRQILLFVGIIIADRGVLDVIRALPTILASRPEVALVVVGDGPERLRLEAEVERMGLEGSVKILGWKRPEQLWGYYQAADIGLLPFRDSPHVRLTLANKLFDYMAAGLPILGSDLPPIRRILAETESGKLHLPDSPSDLARVAIEMLSNAQERQRMGASGKLAAFTKYTWAQDAGRFCDGVGRPRDGR